MGFEVTARDLRLCNWLERANAIIEAFFDLNVRLKFDPRHAPRRKCYDQRRGFSHLPSPNKRKQSFRPITGETARNEHLKLMTSN
jgi:hypothetical protein